MPASSIVPIARWTAVCRGSVAALGAALLLAGSAARPASGQEPSAFAAATAMQRLVVEAIERADRSVVAISRVRRDTGRTPAAEQLALPSIPGLGLGDPTERGMIPQEFGSGVVIDAKGLILTAAHVIGDHRTADYYIWNDRKPYAARLKAVDPWFDLAVLQIDGATLRPMPLGDARSVKKGQFVIALGNPYAIARDGQPSATWGIISNIERQAPASRGGARGGEGQETLHHWGTLLQTDARLELGTSGGALVNLKGEMVGLTTSLAALYGYERPGGFAIPVDEDFRRAVETLKTGRLPDYGFLGIDPASLALDERQQGRSGARVIDVVPATPAALAGLRSGDVITHINGQPVVDRIDVFRRVSGLFADALISIDVLRGGSKARAGRPLTIQVKLSKKRLEAARLPYAAEVPATWRGLRVDYATAAPLFSERSRDLDPAGSVGVIEVDRDSPAWHAGLRPGDFISHVGETRVVTPKDFYATAAAIGGEAVVKLSAAGAADAVRIVPVEEL